MKLYSKLSKFNSKANTSDIQEAINRLSYSNDRTLILPEGLILVDRLFLYYDPIDNPGFNPNSRQGLINLIGQGTVDIAYGLSKKYETGTILKSGYTGSDSCFSAGNSTHNTSPYKSRHVSIKDLTLVGNNTGVVLEANNPEFLFENIKVIQENASGSGLKVGSCWFSAMDRVFVLNNQNNPIGCGLIASSGTSGGLLSFDRGLIDGFGTGVLYEGENYFSNFNITQSAIQHCNIGIRNTTRIISLGLTRVHFEGCTKEIQSDAEIDNLGINNYYSVGRNGISSANISLNAGVRILSSSNIALREGQADYIDLKSNSTSLDSFIDVKGVNYFHDVKGTIVKPVIDIKNNGSGLCRVKVNTHNYLSGRKVILKDTSYDGEWVIQVVDVNHIDLVGSTYSADSTGGECSPICHVVNNIDNIPNVNVSAVTGTDWGINFVRSKL